MSDKTGISWADGTWNPTAGCLKVSPGCKNCYAMGFIGQKLVNHPRYEGTVEQRAGGRWEWTGKINVSTEALDIPIRWTKPKLIFVNSMSDLFHEQIFDEQIDAVFDVMKRAKQHFFLVLTKRHERMRQYLDKKYDMTGEALPNVGIGVSVENQEYAAQRIPALTQAPAAMKFLSCEPLLGPINLEEFKFEEIDWVIAGGESGDGARPMFPDWPERLLNACRHYEVAFHFKQWGQWAPRNIGTAEKLWVDYHGQTYKKNPITPPTVLMSRVHNKVTSGHALRGEIIQEYPAQVTNWLKEAKSKATGQEKLF